MALPNISLAEFNRIASGTYNAGQIDFATDRDGNVSLVKVNNHVRQTEKNNVVLDRQRILDVKETFIAALERGGVKAAAIKEIRANLGLPVDVSANEDAAAVEKLMENRFKPLSRDAVRTILDNYAHQGRGLKEAPGNETSLYAIEKAMATAHMSASNARKRDAVNAANEAKAKGAVADVANAAKDVMAVLSGLKSLDAVKSQRDERFKGQLNAVNEQALADSGLRTDFEHLVNAAIKMATSDAAESGEFMMSGLAVKLVKGADGKISALVGEASSPTKVSTGFDPATFAAVLAGRAVRDKEFLGAKSVQNILDSAYNADIEKGITPLDRTSLTRILSSFIIENQAADAAGQLINGNYNTALLYEIACEAIEGKDVANTKAKLDNYHAELAKGNADLPEDMKNMLLAVADIPFEKGYWNGSEFKVSKPIVADINNAVAQIPQPPAVKPFIPQQLGADGIKNFVADLVFSDDTMVGDVKETLASERMREFLSDDKRLTALIAIVKDPKVLDVAVAPQILAAVKDGFEKIVAALDDAYKAANGESLADAAAKPDFDQKFAAFFKDPQKLTGATLSRFDQIVQSMTNKGCEQIQTFINGVFKVDAANANAIGAVTNDPYKDMSAKEIKELLDKKSLNDILDAASNSESPGQIGFFRQIISTYFTHLSRADKRSAFAAAMRYAGAFDFNGLAGEALDSAKEAAINKFTGAILKGTSPLLQKMLQGLPKDIVGKYADALEDMKCHLAPIPRKVVQAQLMRLINESDGKIKSIELKKSLGAASVGEAFLCEFNFVSRKQKMRAVQQENRQIVNVPVLDEKGEPVYEEKVESKTYVVKIMRHDAVKRVTEEAKIFTAAAEKIPGMAKTWEGQLRQYMTEFDFTNEAQNVDEGVKLYNISKNHNHPLNAIAPDVSSMKMAGIVPPKKDILVCEQASGVTADSFLKKTTVEVRNAASVMFKQDPATGRVLWVEKEIDGKTKNVPVLKDDIPAMSVITMQSLLGNSQNSLAKVSQVMMQATKAWFHEALLGSGKFHGDTHAGNLMVTENGKATFIDFGNLYQLQKNRPDGVNEQHELLRVITGAAFRDKKFILDGFEKLMTDAGRAALDANRAKAEAILDSVLDKKKGGFSFNIVYRLQAAVVELQKLGLELPPQINCFIQSMVRLSNSVTEMNTIANQCNAMVEMAKDMVLQPPKRDDLDMLGKFFDIFASKAGKKKTMSYGMEMPKYLDRLGSAEFGGRSQRAASDVFKPETGTYTVKVKNRILGAADPLAEAEKLVNMLSVHADAEHNMFAEAAMRPLFESYETFKEEMAAADTPEKKAEAVARLANGYARAVASLFDTMYAQLLDLTRREYAPPTTFATGLTDVLLGNFDALQNTLTAEEKGSLTKDTLGIAVGEFGLWWPSPERILEAMMEDAEKSAGDKDYKVDIGV